MGKFIIDKRKDDQYYWKLNATNGETLCHSEGYTTKQGAENGIESCRENAPDAEVVDKS
ncbi:MAG: YegP family protein [Parvibaculales bacterium]